MQTSNPLRISLVILVTLAILGLCPTAAPQTSPAGKAETKELTGQRWTVEDILLAESASDWRISPDGRRAVWVKSRMDKEKNGRVSNLFLTDLETKKEIALTRGTDMNLRPRWSPNGELVAFSSTRPLPKPDPDLGKSQLWLIPAFGGEPYPLTTSLRDIQAFEWADDDTIVFSAQEAPSLHELELKKKKDATLVVDDVAHEPPVRLFKISVKERKITRLTDNTDFIAVWGLSADGRTAMTVHQQYLSFEWDHRILPKIFLYDLRSGDRKEILAGRRMVPFEIRGAPDGSGFYFSAPFSSDPRFFTASITLLYFYDTASGRDVQVGLDWENGLGLPYGIGQGLATTPDGFVTLLAAGARYLPVRYTKSGLDWTRADLEGQHVGNIFGLAVSRDAKTVVYEHSTAGTPTQWVRASLDGRTLAGAEKLTDLNPGFKDKAIARTEIVRWTGALGEEIEGLLYYPTDYRAGRKYPLLTAPHGGPASMDMDQWDESWAYAHQLLTQRGAFILKPNYHGSANYGLKFVESISGGKYYEYPVEDIEKGVDFLIGKGLVDPDRIGTFGWSNGSILSIALCLANPGRYKAASVGAGNVEFISDWGNVEFGQSFDAYYFGASPLEDPDLYVRISPFFRLGEIQAPTIIFFGTEDRNVPTSQGWSHYRALYHLDKVPVKFLLFPSEPHTLQVYAHQVRKLEEEMAWFDRYFFMTEKPVNEAFKRDAPLGLALGLKAAARVGARYGVQVKAGKALIPEVVGRGALEVGRFEVTRAQYAAFDPSYRFAAGTENYPANGIPFEKAKAYAAWLSKLTGETWRLPAEDEAAKLYEGTGGGNTLDHWAGYALNPDDARRLEPKIKELGGPAALLKEVGRFAGAGKEGEEPVFDLGGNVAEWVVGKDGKGKKMGGSADRPSDPKARAGEASPDCTGFRVVRVRS